MRFLKVNELWKYVNARPPTLVRLDRETNIENDTRHNYSKNIKLFQVLFDDILVPKSYVEKPKEMKKTVTISVNESFPNYKGNFLEEEGWKKLGLNKFQKKEMLVDRDEWVFLNNKERVRLSELSSIQTLKYEIFRPAIEKMKDVKEFSAEDRDFFLKFYTASAHPDTYYIIQDVVKTF